MSDAGGNGSMRATGCGDAETTLRLIASLPAPEGLEERVQAGLRAAPRKARLLAWPEASLPAGGWAVRGWMRSVAAAAIVCVVAGGGWSIYSRVQPAQSAHGVVAPRVGAPGGFSEGGAVRRPQTLNGPAVTVPAATGATHSAVSRVATIAKPTVKQGAAKNHSVVSKSASKGVASPAVQAVQ